MFYDLTHSNLVLIGINLYKQNKLLIKDFCFVFHTMKTSSGLYIKSLLALIALISFSCGKHEYPPEYSKAQFTLQIKAGAYLMEWDTVKFQNAAGNKYGVHTLNMYISNIVMKTIDGKKYTSKKIFYLDPLMSTKNKFSLDSIPPGNYTELTFNIGIDSLRNKTFALTSTTDNLNMAWPDFMGGGYHFIKLEGYYLDALNAKKGFAIHLGKNVNLPLVKVSQPMNQKYWDHQYTLSFDVNEVFMNPYMYNFNVDNNYTMADSSAMSKIKINISDAFKINQNN